MLKSFFIGEILKVKMDCMDQRDCIDYMDTMDRDRDRRIKREKMLDNYTL